MRILVVAPTLPWPETTGARIRLANVLHGLRRLGEIDLYVLAEPDQVVPKQVQQGASSRFEVVAMPRSRRSPLAGVRWLVQGRMPIALASRSYTGVRRHFAKWAQPSYDLVWFSRAKTWVALPDIVRGPTIVDLDDLEDHKLEGRLAATDPAGRLEAIAVRRPVRRWLAGLQTARDARLWRRLQRDIAATVDAVVVCSEIDRRRLGVSNAVVIPNGYTYQERPLGRRAVGRPPVIVFAGFLRYPPNVDAAQHLVQCIAPRVWASVPEVQFRLVGMPSLAIERLHQPPRVVVTGFVPEIEAELARADLIAVPLRFGGGTRIKVLEAFAHRIPVVSTSAGVEGLDAVAGRDLLVGDEPETFAAGCVRLLTEPELRRAIVDAAYRLFLQCYRWDDVHAKIASLGATIATGGVRFVHA